MSLNNKTLRIGCCITPHGFGHAARAAAVIEELSLQVQAEFVLVTTVPRWFFSDSLTCRFTYRPMLTDIGLVQTNSLQENLHKTRIALDDFYPVSKKRISEAAERFAGCDLIICDIAPLGILAAQRLAVPSVLLENFTWDWIYSGYVQDCSGLQPHIDYLRDLFSQASYHLQSTPVCQPFEKGDAIPPISRATRTDRFEIRRDLHVEDDEKLVLVTMGGVSGDAYALEPLRDVDGFVFVLGGYGQEPRRADNIRCLAKESEYYHPDLVAAADVVVGKAGYSTLAEVYNAEVSYGYILRDQFPESALLADFIEHNMKGLEIAAADLQSGRWVRQLDALTSLQPVGDTLENGAATAARSILALSDPYLNLKP